MNEMTENLNWDVLVEKVNQAIAKSRGTKQLRLRILLRRYVLDERTESLFNAMKIETEDKNSVVSSQKTEF
jgi:hypothetical protein